VEILRRLRHENIITLVDALVIEDGGDDASFLLMPRKISFALLDCNPIARQIIA
jgi:hypothetical protein